MEKIRTHEISFLEKNGQYVIIATINNVVCNFIPNKAPNTIVQECNGINDAIRVYGDAIKGSENNGWKVVWNGKPNFG